MDESDLEYLQSDNIGEVIAQGMAAVWEARPKNPIQWLSNWLMNHEVVKQNKHQLDEEHQALTELKIQHQGQQEQQKEFERRQMEASAAKIQTEHDFLDNLRNTEYVLDLIFEEIPQYIKQKVNATQVYVGEKSFQRKPVSDDDEGDYEAHLSLKMDQIIKYIGQSRVVDTQPLQKTLESDPNNPHLMLKEHLTLKQGVTPDVFSLEQVPTEVEEEDNNNNNTKKSAKSKVQKYVYVPEVQKDPRVHFFRYPKLGAYIAIPFFYESCISEESFEAALKERISVFEAVKQQELEKADITTAYEEQKAQKQLAGEDISGIEEEYRANIDAFDEVVESDYITQKVEYILCADTLGQDREFTEDEKNQLYELCQFLKKGWEFNQRLILKNDIDNHMNYLQGIEQGWQQKQTEIDTQLQEKIAAKIADLGEAPESDIQLQEFEYKKACVELDLVKELLSDKENGLQGYFKQLQHRRIFLYPQILQNIFYLLGKDRLDVNEKDTHILNWRVVKTQIDDGFFKKVLDYNHRGAKPKQTKIYQKVTQILAKVEGYVESQIAEYNLCYGYLLRWLKLTCALRKSDIELRRAKILHNNELRAELLLKVEEMSEQKNVDRVEYEAKLQEESETEEQLVIDWAEWEKNYDAEHPLPEIPKELPDDVDEDCEFD